MGFHFTGSLKLHINRQLELKEEEVPRKQIWSILEEETKLLISISMLNRDKLKILF